MPVSWSLFSKVEMGGRYFAHQPANGKWPRRPATLACLPPPDRARTEGPPGDRCPELRGLFSGLQRSAGNRSTAASNSMSDPAAVSEYSKDNPFPGRVIENRVLNGPGSAKETRHIVVSI